MKRVNILFVMPQMGMGGAERHVHTLCRRLDKSRFNPSVAWFVGEEALQEFKDLQVPLHFVPKTKRVDFGTMRSLAKIVETEDIDVVNAQHFMPAIYSFYACKLAAKKALVFTAHSRWEVEETTLKWRLAGGFLLRRIDRSLGVSVDSSSAIRSVYGVPQDRSVTIENGVDLDLFNSAADCRTVRAGLGLSDGDVVFGIVANLKTVKNHLFLLKAFAKVAEEIGNVRLVIVGQGFTGEHDNTEEDLRAFVRNHGLDKKVLFLGYRTDIAALLQMMDVFCLTSLREGLPIGLIEAMATGLPVIGTNVEGIRDVITPNIDGVLVELGDIVSLKEALTRLATDLQWRAALGHTARNNAVERYSLQRCVREYEQLFLSLANATHRAE